MLPAQLALLFAAAFAGGALNSVAGGGSFLLFPSLLLTGVPPIRANATNTFALWPGSLASAGAYRGALRHQRGTLLALGAVSLAGGLAGALLLLGTPERAFAALVPWLLGGATLLFAFGPALTRRLRARGRAGGLAAGAMVQLGIAVYGGYFGGGMGIMMLAGMALLGMEDIHAMNGLKAVLAVAINGVAVVAFVLAGVIAWDVAPVAVLGAVLGGYGGARYAQRLDPAHVRRAVIAVGAVLTLWFAVHGA